MKMATVKEVSEFLKVKESTLYSWVSAGLIPSFKVNGLVRFDMNQVEKWLDGSQRNSSYSKGQGKRNPDLGRKEVERIIDKTIAMVKDQNYNSLHRGNQTIEPGKEV